VLSLNHLSGSSSSYSPKGSSRSEKAGLDCSRKPSHFGSLKAAIVKGE